MADHSGLLNRVNRGEPDGELGDNHRSALTLLLPANMFALCKRAGWPHDLEALLALLDDTANERPLG